MDYSTGAAPPRRPDRVMLYFAIAFLLPTLWPLGEAAFGYRAYVSGVPTRATVENCRSNRGNRFCEGQ